MKIIKLVLISFFLSGCASKLAIDHTKNGNGIVVSKPAVHVIKKTVKTLDKNKVLCTSVEKTEFVNLPVGETYTVNIDPSWFAANEFAIEFNDSGSLKKVMLNSDPQIDETLLATATLVKEVGAAIPSVAGAALRTPGGTTGPDKDSCGRYVTETTICQQTYVEWAKKPCEKSP